MFESEGCVWNEWSVFEYEDVYRNWRGALILDEVCLDGWIVFGLERVFGL